MIKITLEFLTQNVEYPFSAVRTYAVGNRVFPDIRNFLSVKNGYIIITFCICVCGREVLACALKRHG
jgi:hypothetical protein